ncbi:hypothetical protein [Actinoplanes sp. NPDC051851]|uniref:hypothetical protein n=1 Tax=Actinoplanes sp. NPDC051851 TaxID=3154753 RepID=UPI003445A045
MTITATSSAVASAWDSHTVYARLESYRRQLTVDLTPVQASADTIAADKAAIEAAKSEVARVEAAQARTQLAAGQPVTAPVPPPAGNVVDVYA